MGESMLMLEIPSVGKYLSESGDDFVLNLVPPTEDYKQARKLVEAEIQKSEDSNLRQSEDFRASLMAVEHGERAQFLETKKMTSSIGKLKSRIRYGGQIARNALNS